MTCSRIFVADPFQDIPRLPLIFRRPNENLGVDDSRPDFLDSHNWRRLPFREEILRRDCRRSIPDSRLRRDHIYCGVDLFFFHGTHAFRTTGSQPIPQRRLAFPHTPDDSRGDLLQAMVPKILGRAPSRYGQRTRPGRCISSPTPKSQPEERPLNKLLPPAEPRYTG